MVEDPPSPGLMPTRRVRQGNNGGKTGSVHFAEQSERMDDTGLELGVQHVESDDALGEDFSSFNSSLSLIGNRRALVGEKVLFEMSTRFEDVAEDQSLACQLTNYRIIMHQESNWYHPRVAIDAWVKDITALEVTDEKYNAFINTIGIILVVGGAVNKRSMEGVSIDSNETFYVNMAPVGFYIIGLLVFLLGYMIRGTVLVMNVSGQNDDQYFAVPIKEEEAPRVNDLIDLIRILQMPIAMRRQRNERLNNVKDQRNHVQFFRGGHRRDGSGASFDTHSSWGHRRDGSGGSFDTHSS